MTREERKGMRKKTSGKEGKRQNVARLFKFQAHRFKYKTFPTTWPWNDQVSNYQIAKACVSSHHIRKPEI